MNAVISLALYMGWLFALFIGVGLIAMAYEIGSRYEHTGLGVTRMGPRLGKKIAGAKFERDGKQYNLGMLASRSKLTMLLLLDTTYLTDNLIPELADFIRGTNDDIQFIITLENTYKSTSRIGDLKNVLLIEDNNQIGIKLGLRVLPYGILVDRSARVVAKGLINNIVHLCILANGGFSKEPEEFSGRAVEMCTRILDEARWKQLQHSSKGSSLMAI